MININPSYTLTEAKNKQRLEALRLLNRINKLNNRLQNKLRPSPCIL